MGTLVLNNLEIIADRYRERERERALSIIEYFSKPFIHINLIFTGPSIMAPVLQRSKLRSKVSTFRNTRFLTEQNDLKVASLKLHYTFLGNFLTHHYAYFTWLLFNKNLLMTHSVTLFDLDKWWRNSRKSDKSLITAFKMYTQFFHLCIKSVQRSAFLRSYRGSSCRRRAQICVNIPCCVVRMKGALLRDLLTPSSGTLGYSSLCFMRSGKHMGIMSLLSSENRGARRWFKT